MQQTVTWLDYPPRLRGPERREPGRVAQVVGEPHDRSLLHRRRDRHVRVEQPAGRALRGSGPSRSTSSRRCRRVKAATSRVFARRCNAAGGRFRLGLDASPRSPSRVARPRSCSAPRLPPALACPRREPRLKRSTMSRTSASATVTAASQEAGAGPAPPPRHRAAPRRGRRRRTEVTTCRRSSRPSRRGR
jgi:hypothetical protein